MDTKEKVEIQQLQSQISKIEAEKRKIELETLEVEKKLKQKWLFSRAFFQALIGGIVGSALIAAWLVGYFEPVLSAKHELAKLENSRIKFLAEEEKRKNDIRSKKFESQIAEYEKQIKEVASNNEKLSNELTKLEERAKSEQKQLQKEIDSLKETLVEKPTEAEKTRLDNLYAKYEKKEKQIKELNSAKKDSENRSLQLSKQLFSIANTKYVVALFSLNSTLSNHNKIKKYFLNNGYTFDWDLMLTKRASWVAVKSTVFYYHENTFAKAEEIASALAKIAGSAFKVSKGAGLGVGQSKEQWTINIHYISE